MHDFHGQHGTYIHQVLMFLIVRRSCFKMKKYTPLISFQLHRVMLPPFGEKRNQTRRSIIFFVVTNYDYVIRCLGGSDKYQPITVRETYQDLFRQIIRY